MKRHLNIRDGFGVFEIAPHDAADFLEPPIERVFVNEKLVRDRLWVRGVLQVFVKRLGEVRVVLAIEVDHVHERRVAVGI